MTKRCYICTVYHIGKNRCYAAENEERKVRHFPQLPVGSNERSESIFPASTHALTQSSQTMWNLRVRCRLRARNSEMRERSLRKNEWKGQEVRVKYRKYSDWMCDRHLLWSRTWVTCLSTSSAIVAPRRRISNDVNSNWECTKREVMSPMHAYMSAYTLQIRFNSNS